MSNESDIPIPGPEADDIVVETVPSPSASGSTAGGVRSFGSTPTSGTVMIETTADVVATTLPASNVSAPAPAITGSPAPAPAITSAFTTPPANVQGALPSFTSTPGVIHTPGTLPTVTMAAPIMGTVIDFKRVKLGGEPKADWSGLASPSRGTPMCHRYASDSNEQKNYALRITLPDDFKFKKKCDLTDLMATLTRHVKAHGLDTVFYVPDPDKAGAVAFVPTDYTRIDWMKVRESVELWVNHCWDQYDLDNDAAAYEMLLKVCDKDMRRTINPYLTTSKKELPASVLLALITSQVEHVTRLTYPTMRSDLMKKSPKNFPGVNIQMFNEFVMPTLVKLEQSRQLTEEVMTWLINSFISIEVSGFSNRIRDQFFDQVIRCYELQGDVTHGDMMMALRTEKLHWEDILSRALELYRNLVSYGQWPHKPSNDTKAPPANFNKVEEVLKGHPDLLKTFQALMASAPNGKQNNGKSKGENAKKDDKGKDKKDRPQDKWPGPKNGEPIFKLNENRLYIWCKDCNNGKGRWQSHHKPKDHGNSDKKLTIPELIKLRKDFQASKTVPAEFNFCTPIVSDEGISP